MNTFKKILIIILIIFIALFCIFGIYLSGISIYSGAWQWVIATLGLIGIIYVMFSGTKRIETRQDKNYGEDEEYKEYI